MTQHQAFSSPELLRVSEEPFPGPEGPWAPSTALFVLLLHILSDCLPCPRRAAFLEALPSMALVESKVPSQALWCLGLAS